LYTASEEKEKAAREREVIGCIERRCTGGCEASEEKI
jgi:hypothetical protein